MASSREEIEQFVDRMAYTVTSKHKINLLGRCSCGFSSRSVDKITDHFLDVLTEELVTAGVTLA